MIIKKFKTKKQSIGGQTPLRAKSQVQNVNMFFIANSKKKYIATDKGNKLVSD